MAASPTLDALKDAIALVVKTVLNSSTPSAVNTVHTKKRFFRDQAKFESFFKRADTASPSLKGKINGWNIYRDRTQEIETDERWRFYQIHSIKVEGFFAIQDSESFISADVFEAQIEAIRDALRLSTAVFGNTERVSPVVQVDVANELIQVGEVSAWHAVLSLEVEGIETKTL